MKRLFYTIPVILAILAVGCPSGSKYNKTTIQDPESLNAHFGDMDADGDDLVNREEFNAYFPNAEPKVFDAIDLNQDGSIDHDEWHEFKEAHGLKHKE
jgi:Ca2+-binding EF-hand superfamily protein